MTEPIKGEILKGIVGSKAYGLDHAGSDTDYMSVFVTPTLDLVGYDNPPRDSIRSTDPDSISYELGKFVLLTAKASVTTSEFLWLPKYESYTHEGEMLLDIRSDLLSQRCKNSYTGYAVGEFRAIAKYEPAYDDRKKYVKKAVTAFRLIEQFGLLWREGVIEPRVSNADTIRNVAEWFVDLADNDRHDFSRGVITGIDNLIETTKTPLPEEPNHKVIRDFIRDIRSIHS